MSDDPRHHPANVLVIDFGTTTSAANLIDAAGRVHPVTDPLSGERAWPSSVHHDGETFTVGARAEDCKQANPHGYRDELKMELHAERDIPLGAESFAVVTLVAEFLTVMRAEAERITAPVTRILVTIPGDWKAGDDRRQRLEKACRAARFDEVEMLFEPVAAAYAAQASGVFAPGKQILVYDLGGGSFDLALVRLGGSGHEILPAHSVPDQAGRQIDELITRLLRQALPEAGVEPDEHAVRHELLEIARRLKRRVGAEEAPSRRSWLGPTFRLTTEQLRDATADVIAATITAAREFLKVQDVTVDELDGVLLAGGGSRMSLVAEAVREAFTPVPVRPAVNPELAVIDGATAWKQRSAQRHVHAVRRLPGELPLRWKIPGDVAHVSRWLVEPGQRFAADAPLLRVTLVDGAHWELRAASAGELRHQHAPVGRRVESGD